MDHFEKQRYGKRQTTVQFAFIAITPVTSSATVIGASTPKLTVGLHSTTPDASTTPTLAATSTAALSDPSLVVNLAVADHQLLTKDVSAPSHRSTALPLQTSRKTKSSSVP